MQLKETATLAGLVRLFSIGAQGTDIDEVECRSA